MGPCRVIVCDDDPGLRYALSMALSYEPGFQVVSVVASALEAIRQCDRLHPDALLMDIGMPGLDGVAAIEQVRAVSPDTRIVILSGRREREADALRAGAYGFVLKGAGLRDAIDLMAGDRSGDRSR